MSGLHITAADIPFVILATLLGLLIGSFLNVCIFRLPRDLSVVKPRSFCPGCVDRRLEEAGLLTEEITADQVPPEILQQSMIAWYDNIPLLSYVLLKGRCRHCQSRIGLRYPLVELLTAIAFLLCALALGPTLAFVKYAALAAILIALTATDLEERILPDEFTLGGAVLGLLLALVVPLDTGLMFFVLPRGLNARWYSLAESVFASLVASGAIFLIGWLYQKVRRREGLGQGDIKMIAMLGAFLGLAPALVTMLLASLVGAVVGLVYIVATRKNAATYELPFGTFLGIAAMVIAGFIVLQTAGLAGR